MGNTLPQADFDEEPAVRFLTVLGQLGLKAVAHKVGELEFENLTKVCKQLLDKAPGAEDYVFPTGKADPTGVWDELDPSHNNFRFMVYIVWLSKQEDSVRLYQKLKEDRTVSVKACIQRLLNHIRDVELQEINQEESAGTV